MLDAMVPQRSTLTVNCHSDFLCHAIASYRQCGDLTLLRQWQEKLTAGGVDAVFCAVGGDAESFPVGYSETRAHLGAANELCERLRDDFRVIHSTEDLASLRRDDRIGLFLGLEGCHALEGRLESMEAFHEQGLRWLALTWNLSNDLGDGTGTAVNGGLTPFGRDAITLANRLGIVVDLAHSSPPTFYAAAAACRAPFAVSHSNAAAVCSHPRNLTDQQIRTVASADGVIGINFFPGFLTHGEARWADVERHICHIVDLVGPRHVGLGPDFIDFAPETMARILCSSGVDYGKSFCYPSGFSDDGCFRDVATHLDRAGFDDDEIADIMGRNVLRVAQEVERLSTKDRGSSVEGGGLDKR